MQLSGCSPSLQMTSARLSKRGRESTAFVFSGLRRATKPRYMASEGWSYKARMMPDFRASSK